MHTCYSFIDFSIISEQEILMVLEWRNHESIRKWMYNRDIIPLENHIKYIKSLKNCNDKKYWLVKRKGISIGVISMVDIVEKKGEWGFYIAPDYHQMKLGAEFYYYSINFLFEKQKFEKIFIFALVENKRANSLNDLFGFNKELIEKQEADCKPKNYFKRYLTKSDWNDNIKNNEKINQLLNSTLYKNI